MLTWTKVWLPPETCAGIVMLNPSYWMLKTYSPIGRHWTQPVRPCAFVVQRCSTSEGTLAASKVARTGTPSAPDDVLVGGANPLVVFWFEVTRTTRVPFSRAPGAGAPGAGAAFFGATGLIKSEVLKRLIISAERTISPKTAAALSANDEFLARNLPNSLVTPPYGECEKNVSRGATYGMLRWSVPRSATSSSS
jgi:hypothetical protein